MSSFIAGSYDHGDVPICLFAAELSLPFRSAGLLNPAYSTAQSRGTCEYVLSGSSVFETVPGGTFGETCLVNRQSIARMSFVELKASSANTTPVCSNLTANVRAGANVDVAPSCSEGDNVALTYTIAAQGGQQKIRSQPRLPPRAEDRTQRSSTHPLASSAVSTI